MTPRLATAAGLLALALLATAPATAQTAPAPATGDDSARVQADLNRRMATALERARAAAGASRLRVETGGYWIQRERDAASRETRWRAAQGLTIVGADAAAILALGAQLQQDGALASGLSWELSEESRRALEDEMTAEAIGRLRARAATVATALGGAVDRIARLSIGDTGGDRPPPMLRAMAAPRAAADAAPMASEPGTELVQVAVQAEIAVRGRQ